MTISHVCFLCTEAVELEDNDDRESNDNITCFLCTEAVELEDNNDRESNDNITRLFALYRSCGVRR